VTALIDLKDLPAGNGKDFEAQKMLVELDGFRPFRLSHLRTLFGDCQLPEDFPADTPDAEFMGKTPLTA
jgi:hypothetical protein